MEQSRIEEDRKITEAYKHAKEFFTDHDYTKALEMAEKSISLYGKNKNSAYLHWLQGSCFHELSKKTKNPFAKCVFLLSSIESFSVSTLLLPDSIRIISCTAHSLYDLAEHLNSDVYYKKTVKKAKQALSIVEPCEMLEGAAASPYGTQDSDPREIVHYLKAELEILIRHAESKMNSGAPKTLSDFSTEVEKTKGSGFELRKEAKKLDEMKRFWAGMSVKRKRDFMVVNVEELLSVVEKRYGSERRGVLEVDIEYAKGKWKWRLWKCGSCFEEFHRFSEFRKHIERKHTEKFRHSEVVTVKIVDESWCEMISLEEWEPVDIKAAEMIRDRLEEGEHIVFEKGWSKDFLSADKERRKILKELGNLLESLVVNKQLSCSLKDWLIQFTVDNLELPADLQRYLFASGLFETPHCISFLESQPLAYINWYFERIGTDITTGLVFKAVDGFWKQIRVKERINIDTKASCLLPDKRLLRGEVNVSDDEGIIEVGAPSTHYSRVSPEGDGIVSWILDCPPIDADIVFRRPIGLHNQDLWLAVLRIIQCMCRKLEKRYRRRKDMVARSELLCEVKELCTEEDRRRRNVPEDQWKTYASILTAKCFESEDDGDSSNTIDLLSVVVDALEGAKVLRLAKSSPEVDLNSMSRLSDVDDDSISTTLENEMTRLGSKFRLIDTKILATENSRTRLLDDLKKLSVIDIRSVILPFLKLFLRERLEDMMKKDSEERLAAAEAFLLFCERSSSRKEQRKSSSSSSVNRKKEVHRYESRDLSEHMKTEGAEQLEHAGGNGKGDITEDPSTTKDQREDIPVAEASTNLSDESRDLSKLTKVEEQGQLERAGIKDKEDTTEDPLSTEEQMEDIPNTATSRNFSDESSDLSELMKVEEEEQLEHAGGEDKANAEDKANTIEDLCPDNEPSSTSEQLKDIQMQSVTAAQTEEKLSVPGSASVELKHDLQLNEAESSAPEQDIPVASTYRNLVDESRDLSELMKAEEEEQLEHAGGEDKANVIEDPSEQLNSSSELGIQMQTVTAEQTEKLPVPESASVELKHDLQLNEAESSAPEKDDITYDSALDMIVKSLWHIGFLRTVLPRFRPSFINQTEDQDIVCALQDLFSLFDDREIYDDGSYHRVLSNLRVGLKLTHPMANGATELLMAVLEFLHYWKNRHRENLVTCLFTLEEFERMTCNRCKRQPNYPEQSSYGIITNANSIRQWKSEFRDMTFEDILKVNRMGYQICCDKRTGGCGKRNSVRHVLTRYPSIFIIALEWEKNETKKEISATANALATEIDISRLYEGVDRFTTYRLVSMIGCSGERDYSCIACHNERWVRHDSSVKEAVGEWRNVVKFCRERKLRPEVLFFESALLAEKQDAL
ncbi:PREDICTED: uncharacterized protein LOC104821900 isoform X2 [Tarenaya hassleriana]|uniref:uncharacterized protein LOC104821900 isoform X2 n=1 Tax=Tarenaya hassleriana TaxID=28532 RepID=UPI00053C918C|nr:PREDICTED: uncharacterized protein LOC104821900 isoform X2 [Tarenaya hassleriana]